jgi:two-component system LytT family response regulator
MTATGMVPGATARAAADAAAIAVADSAVETLRVIVVDDEPAARRRIVRLLQELPGVVVVAACGSGREALRDAAAHRPDVVFLDIAMPGVDGLAVARQITGDDGPLVVFVTAYDVHAVEAFRVHATDYVLKPLDRARLADAVAHARGAVRRARAERLAARAAEGDRAGPDAAAPRFSIRDGRRGHFVPMADILWVESFGNYARVHTTGARYLHRATMEHLAEQLAPHGFVRIHRSVIVNAARIVRLQPEGSGQYEALLDSGRRLRVSRRYRGGLDALWQGRAPA